MIKLVDLLKGENRNVLVGFAALGLFIFFLYIMVIGYSLATPAGDKFEVYLEFLVNGMVHKELNITIRNLQDSSDTLDINTILKETNVDISEVRNIQFFEVKKDMPYQNMILDYGTCYTDNMTGYECVVGSHFETRYRRGLIQRALLSKTEEGELKHHWENVAIQKAGQQKDTLEFVLAFDMPITEFNDGWGSAGTVYVDVNGDLYVDKTHSSWFFDNRNSSKNITITENAAQDLTGYQIFLNVTYDTDMQADFDDIYFVNETNETVNYWVENYTDSLHAYVWIKANYIAASSTTKNITMYYGSPTATSSSSATNTAEVFEDCEDDAVTEWTVGANADLDCQNSVVIKGSYTLNYSGEGGNSELTYINSGIPENVTTVYMIMQPATGKVGAGPFVADAGFADSADFRHENSDECAAGTYLHYDGDYKCGMSWSANTMDRIEHYVSLDGVVNGVYVNFNTTVMVAGVGLRGTASDYDMVAIAQGATSYGIVYLDQLAVFKNVGDRANEPTYSFGAEQSAPVTEFPPQWSNEITTPASPQTYNLSNTFGFQIDWTTPDNVTFESNFTGAKVNYTSDVQNTTTTTYWINFTQNNMTVGSWGYRWFAENMSGINKSTELAYVMNKNTTTVHIAINGTEATTTYPYFQATNVTAWPEIDGGTTSMTRNGTAVSNPESVKLPAGHYNYSANFSDANTTSTLTNRYLIILQKPLTMSIYLNGTNGTRYYHNNTAINITVVLNESADLCYVTNFTGLPEECGSTRIENSTELIYTANLTHGESINVTAWINDTVNYTYSGTQEYAAILWTITADNCTLGGTDSRRFIFKNETSDFSVINGTMDAYMSFSSDSQTYSYNFTKSNQTHSVCIYPAWQNYTVDGHIQYKGDITDDTKYSVRDYHLDSEIFDNVSSDFTLYLLSVTLDDRVKITVKDESGMPYGDIIIKIQRYYPELNDYRTIAVPKSDSVGVTSTYLKLYDVYYRFILQKEGSILDTQSARLITTTDFTIMISPGTLSDWLKYWNQITGNATYSSSTGNITATYNDTSGYLHDATFTVIERGALIRSQICSVNNQTTPSGTMVCHIGNATTGIYDWKIIGNLTTGKEDQYMIADGLLNLGGEISRLFGNCSKVGNVAKCRDGLIIAFLLTLTSMFVGVYNPTVSIVTMMGGVVVTWVLGLFAITITSIIGLMFVAGIIIYRMRV